MFDLEDMKVIEGEAESEEEYFSALQRAINSLHAWKLQGFYGRAMMEAIKDGKCLLGRESCHDYWGNYIPSRTEVKPGTKGSREYVAKCSGEDWASEMETVS